MSTSPTSPPSVRPLGTPTRTVGVTPGSREPDDATVHLQRSLAEQQAVNAQLRNRLAKAESSSTRHRFKPRWWLNFLPSLMLVAVELMLIVSRVSVLWKTLGAITLVATLALGAMLSLKPPAINTDTSDDTSESTDMAQPSPNGIPATSAPASAADTDGAVTTPPGRRMPTFTLPSLQPLVGAAQTVGRVLAGNLHLVGFTVLIAAAAVLWFAAARHVPAVILLVVACLVLVAYIRRSAHYPPFVMAGRPLKIGPRRALWWLWSRFGLYNHAFRWIPQPRPYGLYARHVLALVGNINYVRKYSHTIIDVITLKGGGGKTTVTTWLAAALMHAHKWLVYILDLDHALSKVMGRFGHPNKTSGTAWTILHAIEHIYGLAQKGQQITTEDLLRHSWTDEATGVAFFEGPSEAEPFDATHVDASIPIIAGCTHTTIVDNRPTVTEGAMRAGVYRSCVHVLPGVVGITDHMGGIETTMTRHDLGLSTCTTAHDPETDRDLVVLEKAGDTVVVVVIGVRWHQYNTRTQYEIAERFKIDPDRVVLWPYNRYMSRNRRVLLRAVDTRTLHAIFTLSWVVTKMAVRQNSASGAIVVPRAVLQLVGAHTQSDAPVRGSAPTVPPPASQPEVHAAEAALQNV